MNEYDMEGSINGWYPKIMVWKGTSYWNGWFRGTHWPMGTPILGNLHIFYWQSTVYNCVYIYICTFIEYLCTTLSKFLLAMSLHTSLPWFGQVASDKNNVFHEAMYYELYEPHFWALQQKMPRHPRGRAHPSFRQQNDSPRKTANLKGMRDPFLAI